MVTSLYYFRGVRGRRALVLLSDGEDTDVRLSFDDALDYARESGVVIYTDRAATSGCPRRGARDKLNGLAQATGGRAFYISKAVELAGVYERIEEELRSQYLIAYASDRPVEPQGLPQGGGEDDPPGRHRAHHPGLHALTASGERAA